MIAKAVIFAGVLEACYAAIILPLFLKILLRAVSGERRARDAAKVRPQIREALIDYLSGNQSLDRLRRFSRSHRPDLTECFLEFRTTVSGGASERLWESGLELSLVHDWCQDARSRDRCVRGLAFERLSFASVFEPCRRVAGELQLAGIEDPDPDVRMAAARGLAQSDDLADVELAFELALEQNLFGRIVLSEPLRRQAVALCERAVAEVLRSRNEPRILAALEMVVAWGRAVPLWDMHRLIEEGTRAVRLQAIRVLPLTVDSPLNRSAVVRAISDEDRDIARAAIAAAGRLRIEEAQQDLQRCVDWGAPELAREAAEALAQMAQAAAERAGLV